MSIEEKSLEELERCNVEISKELQKKRSEKILNEGGFICSKCGKVFSKDEEDKEFFGYCSYDGYILRIENIRKMFENLENSGNPIELVNLKFVREGYNGNPKIRLSSTGMINEAIIGNLILKIGNQYVELSQTTPFDEDDEVSPTLVLRGSNPPVEKQGYYYFKEKQNDL